MDPDDVKAITDFLTKSIYPKNFNLNDKRSLRQKSKPFVCCADTEGKVKLFHRGKNGRQQLVICDSQQKREILQAAHVNVPGQGSGRQSTTASGVPHNGINATRRKICERYWWRRIVEDVRTYCKECTGCSHIAATTLASSHDNLHFLDFSESNDSEAFCAIKESLNLPPEPLPIQTVTRTDHSFSSSLLESFSLLWEQQLFTDAIVASEDGSFEKSVHKVVLAAASAYFKSMIVSSIQSVYYIIVPDVSGNCFDIDVSGKSLGELVSYMYTGQLQLSATTALDLSSAAETLVLPGAVELCRNFIAESEQELESQESSNTQSDPLGNGVLVVEQATFNEPVRVKEELRSLRLHFQDAPVKSKNSRSPSKKPMKKKSDVVLLAREASMPDKESVPSSKRGRPVKLTSELIPLGSRDVRVEAISNRDDDDSNSDHAEKSGREIQKKSLSLSQPQRRNPERTKKAGRYVKPLAKKIISPRTNSGVLKNAPEPHSHEEGDSSETGSVVSSSVPGKRGVEARKSQESNCNSVFTSTRFSRIQVSRLTKSQSLKYLSVFRLLQRRGLSTCNSGLFVCPLCQGSFPSMSSFAAHRILHHKEVWACSSCSRKFSSIAALFCHRQIVHSFSKSVAARTKSVQVAAIRKNKFDSQSEQLSSYNKCGWCGQKFANRSKLIEHRRSVHRKTKADGELLVAKVRRKVVRNWSCSEKGCGEHFKVKDKLSEHMAAAHPSVLFSCPECRFKTQVELLLRRHLLRRHRIQHCCHLCGKSYHKPFLLRVHLFYRHKISDPSLKIHKCTHEGCSFECPTKNGLDQHLLKHTLSNSFACRICGKSYKRELGLNKHERKVHLGIRPYMCDKCGASFGDEPELKMHMTRHAESKRFSCDHCSYSTFQKSSIKSHLFSRHSVRMDTEMAVLQCSSCQFITDKRCRFNDHMKMHQNIRDIPCSHCDKLFVTRKTLRQHINKVHRRSMTMAPPPTSSAPPVAPPVEEHVLACRLCQFRSLNSAEMNEHIRTIHSSELFARNGVADYLGHVPLSDDTSMSLDCPNSSGAAVGPQSSQVIEEQPSLPADATQMEYHLLQHVPIVSSSGNAPMIRSVDAMSMPTVNSIIIGIPIQMESTHQVAGCMNFQPFDSHGRLMRLQ